MHRFPLAIVICLTGFSAAFALPDGLLERLRSSWKTHGVNPGPEDCAELTSESSIAPQRRIRDWILPADTVHFFHYSYQYYGFSILKSLNDSTLILPPHDTLRFRQLQPNEFTVVKERG